jgi:hypothetical protein
VTAITILNRAILVLDHWPVEPLLPFAERLGDLTARLLCDFRPADTQLDRVADPCIDHTDPRVDVRRSGDGHPAAPFWLYSRVAHHAEHTLDRVHDFHSGLVGKLTGLAVRRSRLAPGPSSLPP